MNYTEEERRDRLETYTMSKEGITLSEATEIIKANKGDTFTNKLTGDEAVLSNSGANKIISNKAVEKSVNNGFSKKQHNEVASKVGKLYKYAYLFDKSEDRDQDANILSIKRFVAPIIINDKVAGAYITVKEIVPNKQNKHKHSIYSVEEIKLGQLLNLGKQLGNQANTYSITALINIIEKEVEKVKGGTTTTLNYTEEQANDVIDNLTDDEATNLVNNAKSKGYAIPLRLAERVGDIDTLNKYADLDNLKLLDGVDYVAQAREYIENLDINANEETLESNLDEVLNKAKEQFVADNTTEDTSNETKDVIGFAFEIGTIERSKDKDNSFLLQHASTKEQIVDTVDTILKRKRRGANGRTIIEVRPSGAYVLLSMYGLDVDNFGIFLLSF